jgi:hypothetical protein
VAAGLPGFTGKKPFKTLVPGRQKKFKSGCIISHSAAIPIAIGTVVNFKEAHVFEKLLRNFSKTCASKEFYLPPQAAI